MRWAFVLIFGFVGGCRLDIMPPRHFVTIVDTTSVQWKTVEFREGLSVEDAWKTLVDTVASKYDVETMDKDAGYLRSGWAFATGIDPATSRPFSYGRRLTVKFASDGKGLRVKTEAYYEVPTYQRLYGVDSAFNEDVWTEIAGKVGRGGS